MKIYVSIPDWYRENCASRWTKFITEQAKDTIEKIMNEEEFELYDEDGRNKLFPFFEEEDRHSRWVFMGTERIFFQFPEFQLLFEWEEADFIDIYSEDMDIEEIQEEKESARERYMSQLSKAGFNSAAEIKIPAGYVFLGSYSPNQDSNIKLPGLDRVVEVTEDGEEVISSEVFETSAN